MELSSASWTQGEYSYSYTNYYIESLLWSFLLPRGHRVSTLIATPTTT